MKITFSLDVKLIKNNHNVYTTGAANYKYFNEHRLNEDDLMTVICREDNKHKYNDTLAISSGKNLSFILLNSYKDILNFKYIKLLKNEISKSDLVIIKQPSIIGDLTCHIAKKMKKKYLVDMVGCPWDALTNKNLVGKMIAPFMYLVTRKNVKDAEGTIYVSESFLQKRYPTNGKSIGCSDVQLDNIKNNIIKNRENRIINLLNQNKIILGTIGGLNVKYKGFRHVIKSLSYLKKIGKTNFTYQIVGVGDKKEILNLARKYNVEEMINIIGTIDHKDIFSWLDNIDIYIQPSDVEGLCRSIVEAMSRGCPCIVSDVGGNVELIDDQFIFKKKNYKDLTDKLLRLLSTKEIMIFQAKHNFTESKEKFY